MDISLQESNNGLKENREYQIYNAPDERTYSWKEQ